MKRGNGFKDITGMIFGYLKVISYAYSKKIAYWNCVCKCGKKVIVRGVSLRIGQTKSCGCLQKEISTEIITKGRLKRLIPGDTPSSNEVYGNYKRNAKSRNLDFILTKEEFYKITKENCFYCGVEAKQIYKAYESSIPYIYNGIDRIDNSLGYILENCVPCCGLCNQMKMNETLEKFEDQIRRIYKNRGLK